MKSFVWEETGVNEIVRFSTDSVPVSDRATAWNAAISDAYFPLSLHFRDTPRFQGRLSHIDVGGVGLSRLTSEPVNYERRNRHIRSDAQEDYLITIPRSTSVQFQQMGKEVSCDPGGFIIERGDEPYRFMYERPNDLFVLKVAKSDLVDRVRQPDRFCAQVFDATAGSGALFISMVEQSQRHAPDTKSSAGAVIGRQMLELLALTIEQADLDSSNAQGTAVRAAHMVRIEEFIRQNIKNPKLTPDAIAAGCGISKRYLHDLCKTVNGTVSQFVRDERLKAARDQLELMPDVPIAEVAYRFGFADQAQFSRLFKARFDVTPTGFRADLHK